MITTVQMYWLTRLDTLEVVGILLTVLGSFAALPLIIIYNAWLEDLTESAKHTIRTALRIIVPAVILGFAITIFVPNTKEMSAIWVVPKLANSESVSEIADGIKTLAVEWLEELRPGKERK